MASQQTIWGIDMGRCALKAIKLRGGEDHMEVIAAEYIEHAKILTQPDANRSELIAAALEKFLSRHDLSKDGVVIAVPGQHTLARFTKLPPVTAKRIPDIVRYEADQQIPFDMDEVIWDYQTFQEEGTPDLEVGIFAMKRELIREHLLHFEQASIEPVVVQSSPLAVYNGALYDGQLGDETTILLDIGSENTDLIIATRETFWTRTVPIGGNHFTEALVKSFKLSFAKAESLKRTAEASKYARQIFQAMRPIFADLVQELQRSIGFYSSTHRDAKVEKIVCMGNAFRLPGLVKYLQQNLGLAVEKIDGFKKASGSVGPDFKEQILSFGVAYGLAIQGLDQGKVNSNLLPMEIAKQVVWRKKRPTFAAAAACLFISGALIWFRYTADMSALAAGAEDNIQSIKSVESAMQIINNGPSAGLSDRGQAILVQNAGNFLKKEMGKLRGQGDRERKETETIIQIQHNKRLVPAIFQVLHESLPAAPGALSGVTTAEDYALAVRSDSTPRALRQEITLHSIHMHFDPDVNLLEWVSLTPVPEPINDPDEVLPAMKITLFCRTPFQGDSNSKYTTAMDFLSKTFLENLRIQGRLPDQGFYFDRVFVNFGGRVEVEGGRKGGGAAGGGFGAGRGGRFGGGLGSGQSGVISSVNPMTLDPLTQEKITEDWEFEIWIDVVMEDYPGDEEDGE